MNNTSLTVIQDRTRATLSTLLPPGTHVALIHFPNHMNAGDSLIWLGTRSYLNELGVVVDYVADMSRYDRSLLEERVPTGPILIHGGGNLGDRWDTMQEFREKVIQELPHRRIIQLPQSIEFSKGPKLEKAQRIFAAHPDLTLLIRDHDGVEVTRSCFPTASVVFCPDLALGYGPIRADQSADGVQVVELLRTDSEKVASRDTHVSRNYSFSENDWGLTGLQLLAWQALHAPGALMKRLPATHAALYSFVAECYERQAALNVQSAIQILSKGEVVVTDRLHAVVFASLMGKPVVAIDNANGKVSAIIRDYLGTIPGVLFVEDLKAATSAAAELVA